MIVLLVLSFFYSWLHSLRNNKWLHWTVWTLCASMCCLTKCLLCWCIFTFPFFNFIWYVMMVLGTVMGTIICGDSWGWEWLLWGWSAKLWGWVGNGDHAENSNGDGVGMGMTGAGTVGDGDKYLCPCSSQVSTTEDLVKKTYVIIPQTDKVEIMNFFLFFNLKNMKSVYRSFVRFSKCFHCSWEAYWIAAYGMMRTSVALFPLHKLKKPSLTKLRRTNRMAPRSEYLLTLDTSITTHTFCSENIHIFCTEKTSISNKKYVLSNSESVQCNFFIFDHVTFIQLKICCCVQNCMKIG